MDRFLHLLTAEVERSGRHVLLFTGTDIEVYADLVAQRAVDAFVVADTVDQDQRHQWLADHGVPFVSFGRTWSGSQPGPWVDLDGAAVCHRLVDGLHDLGRRRIAFVARRGGSGQFLDRQRGWLAGCAALDLPAGRLAVAEADTVAAGGAAMRDLLDSEVPPDAVIAVSDPLAVGVLREVRRQGLRPGTDVAVTGFDDSPLASVVDGGLTSVRQPVERFARTVVDLLDSTNGDRGVLLPGEIVSRGSAPLRLTEQDVNRWESR
ncbi:substrate-binding domain-containing protein [Saccharothrix sp. ALI-22-I]|uniref:substrate-binding domain-containing protein n=1 Tax=Saccharothrix sp. ALI-22-I TaxID=1933778 RepID=UPI001EE75173|nr:substrate-binding domain-containing protein [Saccharothrix sp. ALI-22-I]